MRSPVSVLGCRNHVTSRRAACPIYRTTPGFVTYEHRNSLSANVYSCHKIGRNQGEWVLLHIASAAAVQRKLDD